MRIKANLIIVFIIFQVINFSNISLTNAAVGDVETPKTASLGANTGNISSNAAGGRFYFNFTVESGKGYNFQLNGDTNTKFDIYFFKSNFYPTIIIDDSAEYANAYPVKFDAYSTENSWAFIQIFSNHEDGGVGDFTLSISESGSQSSSSTGSVVSSSNTGTSTEKSNDSTSPAFEILLGGFTMIIVTVTSSIKRNKKFGK